MAPTAQPLGAGMRPDTWRGGEEPGKKQDRAERGLWSSPGAVRTGRTGQRKPGSLADTTSPSGGGTSHAKALAVLAMPCWKLQWQPRSSGQTVSPYPPWHASLPFCAHRAAPSPKLLGITKHKNKL